MTAKRLSKANEKEELVAFVRIAHSAPSNRDGMEQLDRWLKRERDDILLDKENFALRDP